MQSLVTESRGLCRFGNCRLFWKILPQRQHIETAYVLQISPFAKRGSKGLFYSMQKSFPLLMISCFWDHAVYVVTHQDKLLSGGEAHIWGRGGEYWLNVRLGLIPAGIGVAEFYHRFKSVWEVGVSFHTSF